jgi:hypothetical protein
MIQKDPLTKMRLVIARLLMLVVMSELYTAHDCIFYKFLCTGQWVINSRSNSDLCLILQYNGFMGQGHME